MMEGFQFLNGGSMLKSLLHKSKIVGILMGPTVCS